MPSRSSATSPANVSTTRGSRRARSTEALAARPRAGRRSPTRLGARAHGRAVERDVAAARERREQRRPQAARQLAAQPRAERALDREVGRRGDERRPVDAPRGHGRERALEQLLALARRRPRARSASAPPRRDRRTPIRPAARRAPGSSLACCGAPGAARSRRPRRARRRPRGSRSRSSSRAGRARGAPTGETSPPRVATRSATASSSSLLAAHRARARELDALRPHRRRARGADRREQRVEVGRHAST